MFIATYNTYLRLKRLAVILKQLWFLGLVNSSLVFDRFFTLLVELRKSYVLLGQ